MYSYLIINAIAAARRTGLHVALANALQRFTAFHLRGQTNLDFIVLHNQVINLKLKLVIRFLRNKAISARNAEYWQLLRIRWLKQRRRTRLINYQSVLKQRLNLDIGYWPIGPRSSNLTDYYLNYVKRINAGCKWIVKLNLIVKDLAIRYGLW